jgi:hypothetical protein
MTALIWPWLVVAVAVAALVGIVVLVHRSRP